MARKYREIKGIGRCSITLHGESHDGRSRLVIASETVTRRVFAIIRSGKHVSVTPVTSMTSEHLLELLDRYHLSLDPIEPANARSHPQFVAGK